MSRTEEISTALVLPQLVGHVLAVAGIGVNVLRSVMGKKTL